MTGFVVCILVAIDVEFGLKFEGTLRDANMHEFGLPHFLRSGVKTTGFTLAGIHISCARLRVNFSQSWRG